MSNLFYRISNQPALINPVLQFKGEINLFHFYISLITVSGKKKETYKIEDLTHQSSYLFTNQSYY